MKIKTMVAALLCVALPLGGLWLGSGDGEEKVSERAVMERVELAYTWPRGRRVTYAMAVEGRSRVTWGTVGQQLEGRLLLAGELALTTLGSEGELEVVGARFASLDQAEVSLGSSGSTGGDAAREALLGHEAVMRVGRDGRLVDLSFAPSAPALFRHVAGMVLGQAQVVLQAGTSWEATQTGAHGTGVVRYQAEAMGEGAHHLVLSRSPYAKLTAVPGVGVTAEVQGALDAVLAREGHLASISGREEISARDAKGREVGTISLDLDLTAVKVERVSAQPASREGWARLDPSRVDAEGIAERSALEGRVAGMTFERMSADLLAMGSATTLRDHERWLWRATGLLELHPELAAELAKTFGAAGAPARALICDLLANTGNTESQAALRSVLSRKDVREDGSFRALVQRYAVMRSADEESVSFLGEVYASSAGDDRMATAYALGSAIGAAGASPRAEALARQVAADLGRTSDVAERRGLLDSLGNAGRAETLGAVLAHASDADAGTRAAVARALRKVDDGEAARALLALAGDTDVEVQREALSSIATRRSFELSGLRGLIDSGAIGQAAFPALLQTLATRNAPASEKAALIDAMLLQPISSARLAHQMRKLRASLSEAAL